MAPLRAGVTSGRIVGVDGDYVIVMVHKRYIEQRRTWNRLGAQRSRERAKAAKALAAQAAAEAAEQG